MKIGEKMRSLRQNKNISVYRLSRLADVSENYIHEIENNKKTPSIVVLEKLITPLGYTLSEFFRQNSEAIYVTEEEMRLLSAFRTIAPASQKVVQELIDLLSP